MPDPFSVISGAAGVVSLGLTTCQGLVAYYGPFKSFSTETESFVTSAKGLSATLELLKSRINRLQSPVNPYVVDELQLVSDRINDCETALQHLSQTLKKCQGYDTAGMITRKGKAFARAQYPFKRGTLVSLNQMVTGLRSNLDIALHAIHLAMSHCIQQQNTSFLAVSQSIASDVATLPPSLQHLQTNQQEILQIVTSMQQLQLTAIDQSTQLSAVNSANREIAAHAVLPYHRAHTNTQSVGKDCTCTMTGSWLFRSSSIMSGIRGHQFGCPKYYDREVTTVVRGKFTILNRFWGYSAYIGFQVIREDASITMSPTLSVWPVVDGNSPAFQILCGLGKYENINDALAELRSLYSERRASPRDTLRDGQTLIHLAVHQLPYLRRRLGFAQCCQFLKALVELSPVGLNQQSSFGGTVFDTLLHIGTHGVLDDTDDLSSDVRALASLSRVLIDHGAVVTIESAIKLPTYLEILDYHDFKSSPNYLFLPTVIDDCGAEEFPFSRLELSVLQRDEVAITEILGRIGPDDRLTTEESCAYTSAISWPRGLRIMLNLYVPESLWFLLHEALIRRQFESAEIVMTAGKCYISNLLIQRAAKFYNPRLFKMLADNLAAQRRFLRQQADRLLSPSALHDLGLSNSEGLLDSKAFKVETALGDPYKGKWLDWAEVSNRYWANSSVYHMIGSNVDAAKTLYSQGFTDVNQLNVKGLAPLSALEFSTVRRDLGKFLGMCEWLLDKGASLHCPSRPSPSLLTPGHNVACIAGDRLRGQLQGTTFRLGSQWSEECEIWIPVLSQAWFTQCVNHWTLLQQVFTDTQHHDGCSCACASNGCLPLNVFLRTALCEYWWVSRGLPGLISGYIVAGILDDKHLLAPGTVQQLHDRAAPVAIRVCTFQALGLRHTCRYHYGPHPELGNVELDDIVEVQEEERFLIDQLELLVSEFEGKYKELCVSLPEFLRGYWAERMEEVLTEAFDEDEAHAMEEAGVVLEI